MDSTVGKVLGFVCNSRSIKTARGLFKQLKGLPTMGFGTDFLKTYEQLIPTALHHQGKTFTTQIESLNCSFRHYLADCTGELCATGNPKGCWKFLWNCSSINSTMLRHQRHLYLFVNLMPVVQILRVSWWKCTIQKPTYTFGFTGSLRAWRKYRHLRYRLTKELRYLH